MYVRVNKKINRRKTQYCKAANFTTMRIVQEIQPGVPEAVLKHYGRTTQNLRDDTVTLRKWLETQPHIPETPSDELLKAMLILNKHSIENAKKKIDAYYTIRKKVPEVFDLVSPDPRLLQYCDINYWIPLPKLTDDLYRVSCFKLTTDDADKFNPYLFFALTMCVTELRILQDRCLSDIIIVDLGNCGFGHLTKVTPMMMKKAATVLEKMLKSTVKGFHFINSPAAVEPFLKIFKSVLKPKVANRIFVHTNIESLYEHISRKVLPKDYGGEEKSLKELNENLKQVLLEYKPRFDHLASLRINEDLRPEKLIDDELLGFHGNFKKLSVD